MQLTICAPLRLVSALNAREHWTRRAKRNAEQRAVVRMLLASQRAWPPRLPVQVEIVRIGPRALDGDNLQGACKSVRDAVADALVVDDADARVRWEYSQRSAGKRGYGVEVTVREVSG